ncbi:MAG: hypothetical protein NC114_06275 [Ruminococcus flavefaciens]|nr:hypothetical protein [Ruminococcus flavefaciens]
MKRPVSINFLTPQENECLELLVQAQDMFDAICKQDPQNSTDAYNFGHYVDAARTAVLVRGARRMDSENLLVKHSPNESTTKAFDELMKKLSPDQDTQPSQIDAPRTYPRAVPVSEKPTPYSGKSTFKPIEVSLTPELRKSIMETVPGMLTEILNKLEGR